MTAGALHLSPNVKTAPLQPNGYQRPQTHVLSRTNYGYREKGSTISRSSTQPTTGSQRRSVVTSKSSARPLVQGYRGRAPHRHCSSRRSQDTETLFERDRDKRVKKWLVGDRVKGDDLQWVSFPGEVKLYLLSDGTRPEGTNSKVLGFISDPPAIRTTGC